ncbi:MAG TPA: outer membrane protein assembly factor BamD [Blastocatellia bacterium]|nr:outer membrane protein assembly factor BamD [Blastocatellia bacterium]
MKAVKYSVLISALVLSMAACGGKAKQQVTLEEAKAGRDQELFREGVNAIRKGRFEQGRILLNTMINTYSDSPMTRMAKLSIADSFYLEGGSKSLAQAEVEYRDWVQFFPDDALADDVMLKMAEIHLRQVMAADRDTTHAKLAERQLKEMLRRYPGTDKKDDAEGLMAEVQEILAQHELTVGKFYYEIRESAQAAQMRTEEILNKYPNFSRFDEALFLHARSMADQEDTETASQDLTRLVTNYPFSEFRPKAEELLKRWKKPVPEPDPAKVSEGAPEGKGLPSRMLGFVFGPKIDTSGKGVIIDRELNTDQIVARAQEMAGTAKSGEAVTPGAATTSNSPDARPRRATGAAQDVEVKAGSSATDKDQTAPGNSKPNKKTKDKKKPDEGTSKVLRNP